MLIKNIKLINFRNFEDKEIVFDQNLNIILGKNGVGKTNILEGIHLLSNMKSFRKQGDNILLKRHTDGFNIVLKYQEKDEHVIEYQYSSTGLKKIYYDNNLVKKISEIYGKFLALTYTPSDVYLFSESPEDRRKIVDEVLSLVDNTYLYSLTRYKKILKDRNQLFIQEVTDDDIINLYSDELIAPGYKLLSKRREFTIFMNKRLSYYYNSLFGEDEVKIKLTYINPQKLIMDYEKYLYTMRKLFKDNKSSERMKKTTIFGPHRDDFSLSINSINLQEVGSQSQTKVATLAFKLALADFIYSQVNIKPILLLDDITSDFDEIRVKNLLKLIKDFEQVIITTTDEKVIENNDKIIKID